MGGMDRKRDKEQAIKKLHESAELLRLAHEEFLQAFRETQNKQMKLKREILDLLNRQKMKQTLEKILSLRSE